MKTAIFISLIFWTAVALADPFDSTGYDLPGCYRAEGQAECYDKAIWCTEEPGRASYEKYGKAVGSLCGFLIFAEQDVERLQQKVSRLKKQSRKYRARVINLINRR